MCEKAEESGEFLAFFGFNNHFLFFLHIGVASLKL